MMKTRKSYLTVQFVMVLTLTLVVMWLPTSDVFKSLIANLIPIEWLRMSVSVAVSASSLALFLWLAPKTSVLTGE
jgi:hypothetical protein